MFNVILVDDDITSIKLLSEIVSWNELGYCLDGVYSDGIQAIEHIKQHKVDLIITDIAMSCIDGLQLCKMCDRDYPNIKVVLISAYRNFEYAQTAISYKNVVDYITKPIDFEKLNSLLQKVHDELKKSHQGNINMSNNARLEFFSNLLCGYINSPEQLRKGFDKLNIQDSVLTNPCYIIHFHIHGFSDYMKTVWQHSVIQVYNAIANMFHFEDENSYYSIANYFFGNFSWIILFKDNKNIETVLSDFKTQIVKNAKCLLNMDITCTSQSFWTSPYIVIDESYSEESKELGLGNEISTALEYMNTHYMDSISLSDVAEQVYMTSAYFSAFFKKETGTNFIKTLTNIRLERATELMLNTDKGITEICYAVGYNHVGNFLDKFKKKYNMTPNEYRKQKSDKE